MAHKTHIAFNFQLAPTQTGAYQLLPVGTVQGRDSRSWINDNPEAVIDAIIANGQDIPIDINHATELKAPNGDEAPAQGWVRANRESIKVEDGFITVRPEWNSTNPVDTKEYRYWSPVILFSPETNRIQSITSIGLTNQPNLFLPALNSQQSSKENTMLEEILRALGLPVDADSVTALNAISKLKADTQTALNSAKNPSLDKFVPRADYDTALNRASTAESRLADSEKAKQAEAIEVAINAALEAGKIVPASVDYHKAQCATEGGLARFKVFVDASPEVSPKSGLDGKKPADSGTAMNAEEKLVAGQLGLNAAQWKQAKEAV